MNLKMMIMKILKKMIQIMKKVKVKSKFLLEEEIKEEINFFNILLLKKLIVWVLNDHIL